VGEGEELRLLFELAGRVGCDGAHVARVGQPDLQRHLDHRQHCAFRRVALQGGFRSDNALRLGGRSGTCQAS
jgi:hypothetical protein